MQAELTTPRGVFERLGDVTVVDVREPYEWNAGRIDGAVHIPLNQLMSGAGGDLEKDKPLVMVCRVGNRSDAGEDSMNILFDHTAERQVARQARGLATRLSRS